ncbi:amino acid ABC transporter substrate-binding protein [Mycolicibacterium moriokaense]|nr:amino acid ABC transporter substrate-binding protein [Mycolicibacterium moriokaense]
MPSPWSLAPALVAVVLVSCAPVAEQPAAAGLSQCGRDSLDTLYRGVFTYGTDQPVYPPWYMGDAPDNGEGFESAVAYAVADRLGYPRDDVRWVRVPFNAALAPGPKGFDAGLAEFSITDQRKAAVDFSTPYFDVTQAVVTVKTSPAAGAQSIDALRPLRLGVQVGTTSYTAASAVNGQHPVSVYNTNGDAKMALSSGEIDALVADLPTAFAVANELRNGVIVGQLPSVTDDVEQFGMVLTKDSKLTRCVSAAVDTLRDNGTLTALQKTWLAEAGKAPVLR